ncbi:thiamine-phosphate pyrophosphorylase [Caminibacter pacificus]|uniref:Thiamine-phosphate pyrophosphorylase n=1 Tax=Caminibacter pacificus TaxID=1424653 RepID=A0AAJ4RBD4_9BACT|nr:thiamine-phosphate pyrophosphorylase [Caminibacter pacificus]QCI27466.1 thiamine-phosphate pyrophosphorylase [Caminibacter pacificus]ROR38903.1 thiamine-phosphate pyrophosphorylase [Caminibacter pacificus]
MRTNPPLRTIDANFNRFKEGIRVVEDILRYELNSPLAKELKNLRHIKIPNYLEVIKQRDAQNDILKPSTKSEQTRKSLEDIIISNLKRAQESARVLEEVYKLDDIKTSEEFKNARYKLYTLEKEILLLIQNI